MVQLSHTERGTMQMQLILKSASRSAVCASSKKITKKNKTRGQFPLDVLWTRQKFYEWRGVEGRGVQEDF